MTVNAELALAAARVRLLSEQIPAAHRPDVAGPWRELQDELDRTRSDGGRVLAILEWRVAVEGRLSTVLSALAELTTATSRVRRLHADCPRAHRPSDRAVYGALEAAKADVVQLADRGRDHEARAIVVDWECQAASRISSVLAHAPLASVDP
jgi:hypothetical protein